VRGPQASAQARQGNGQRRDHGRRQERQAAPALPSEKTQQSLHEQQREYHRQQMAEENRRVAAPAGEQREKKVAALFGWVGKKAA
jgi:hypothetical protein